MTGKGEDINGYDNHGYDDHTEIGMRPMPTGPDNSGIPHRYVEENSDRISSNLGKNRSRYRIMIFLLLFLLAALIGMGVALYIFIHDDSAVVFEEIKTTSKTPVKTTTMTALDPGEIVAIGVHITLVDRTFTDDLRDESTHAYVTFTNDIISSIDAAYQHDAYYKEAAVISVSPGSIKVDIMMTFDMPMAGRERSNAIEFTLNNLTHNMQNAFDENTIIDVTTAACDIEPCSNGASCNDIPNSSDYICTCVEGFTGKSCQNDIDECENNPCLNGGQCDNTEGSYLCSCNGGYTGVNCEQVKDCGFRPAHSSSSPRIIGGSQTQLGDWPWMVSLRDRSNVHRCAAVLINSTRAITAAHCVKKFDAAVLGDLLLSLQSAYHVETDVTAAIHPDYDINSITNDIAVIEFTTSVDFSDFVRPICYLDQDASATFRACYVTGWGHTSEGGHVSDTLLEATVELFDQTQCQSFYPDLTIPSTMMCAGRVDGLMDTCQGDTGGPLQCEDQDGRFHLIGITSFGYGCGRENYPGVYTKVSEYHDFITSADPQPEPEPVLAVGLVPGRLFEFTLPRLAQLEYQWIFHAVEGNAIDIYIFTFDIIPVLDTVLIGRGSDPSNLDSIFVDSRNGPVHHVYRVFDDYAWGRISTWPETLTIQGIRGIAEGVLVEIADNSDSCASEPCGEGNICIPNAAGYSCICLDFEIGSSCKNLSFAFSGDDNTTSYIDRQVPLSTSTSIECNFDTDLCGWTQVEFIDTVDWNRFTGSEPYFFIGPLFDHTEPSQSGSYVYVEDSGISPEIIAGLSSSKFPGIQGDARQCFTFYYYISSGDVVDLTVYFVVEGATERQIVWSLPGKVLNRWLMGQFELGVAGSFIITARLEGVPLGFISVDDIQVTDCLYNGNVQEDITLVPGNIVYMSSPNFPNVYPNDVSQLWTITAPKKYGARFDIDVINIEDSFERLAIGTGHDPADESSILESWTGHHLLQSVTRVSLQFQYWVSFRSDLTIREQGFVIAIYPVRFEEYFVTMESGKLLNITSPNYPMTYPNSQILLWLITAPPQHGLYFRFARFATESQRDMVIVGTGESPSPDAGIRLAELSGFITPSDIVCDDNEAWIMFRPDFESIEASGFFVEVRTVERPDCGEADVFHCPNGHCLSMEAVCDGYNDCKDFTDEEHCPICVALPARCSHLLPYNMTYFPNQHATSLAEAESILVKVTDSCPQLFSGTVACNMLFPECLHHGPTLRRCKSSCMQEEEICAENYETQHGEDWPLGCDSLPETEEDFFGRCTGPDGDVLNTSLCGTRPAFNPYQPRIVGGVNAQEGEFPWMVYLYSVDYGQICGATLISSDWVVTAAHCVWGITDLLDSVIMGDLHLSINSEHHLAIAPDDIFIHPEYNDITSNADIALIKLSEPVSFTEYVRPACLSQTLQEFGDYTTCIITGWGDTEHVEADTLRKAVVRLIEGENCKKLYDIPDDYDTQYLLCAGFERGGIDTCQGDSGGPLVCEGADGRWHLTGVTSFGNGCADPGFPGIYARVSTLLPFLESVISGEYPAPTPMPITTDPVVPTSTSPTPIINDTVVVPTPEYDLISLNIGLSRLIFSPNYPGRYPDDSENVWEIIPPADSAVLVHFINFESEDDSDFLYIYNGDAYSNETLVARISGSTLPRDLAEVTSKMWIRFQSDYAGGLDGFLLTVTAISIPFNGSCARSCCTSLLESCNRGDCYCDSQCSLLGDCCWDFPNVCEYEQQAIKIDLEVGETVEITSPNYPQNYPRSLEIFWGVHAPANYRVLLRFIVFNTEATYDFLYVDASREPVLSFSGEGNFDDIISSSTYMVLRFVSDFSNEMSGFKLELSAVHEGDLTICKNGEITYQSLCNGQVDCSDKSDEFGCSPFELEEGESITFQSRSKPQLVDESPLEWSVVSTDPTLDLIVIVDYVELQPGDVIRVTSIEADIGEDYVWTIEGPLSKAFGEAADKVFPSGNLLIQATTLAGTRDFTMEVMALHPQDISGCPGTDRIIIPQKMCDGIVTCPDNSDEPTCGPLETIVLNEGEVASIQTPGFPLLVTALPLQMVWTIQVTPPSRILIDVLSLITEASHTLMIGTGLDYSDEGTIIFKAEGLPFNDEYGIEVGDINPPGNSMWISIEKPLTDVASRLVLSANIRAVSEESLQCLSSELSCGGIFHGCYNETSSCDGIHDCFDGADEDCDCPSIKEIRCGPLNTCLHRSYFCNGRQDCDDDESGCTFVCDNGNIVNERFICDGHNDCGDYTDEPPDCVCASNQFDCGERCIPVNDVCNEEVNCANGADEANCICKSSEIQCDNGECTPFWTLCDGKDDCTDGSDELEDKCRVCDGNYFQCQDFSKCLAMSSVCDSESDCNDGSDELVGCPRSLNYTIPPIVVPTDSPSPPEQTLLPSFIPFEDCGLRPALEIHRVTHGEDVTGLGEWPWQIALYTPNGQFCGGSIITPEWILTAAHCVDFNATDDNPYTIKAGSLLYFTTDQSGQSRDVQEVIRHRLYGPGLINDIALLKLVTPLNLTNEVQPVCLPSADESIPKPEEYVTFTGWGSFTERNTRQPDLLQEGRMPVIPNYFCHRLAPLGLTVEPTMFCTMYHTGYQGVCTGDSGGPIVQEINGRWTLVGISSWVRECGAPYVPNGFTRVSSFIDWIQDNMTEN